MMLASLLPALAPVGGFAHTAAPSAPSTGLRTFRVYVEDCLQVTLRCPDAAAALKEAEAYRQPGDDLCVWEGSRIVGTITSNATTIEGPIRCAYTDSGIPRGIGYFSGGPRPEAGRGKFVIPEAEGRGWFMLLDMRPAEQLDAIDRFLAGARDPETFEMAMQGMRPQV